MNRTTAASLTLVYSFVRNYIAENYRKKPSSIIICTHSVLAFVGNKIQQESTIKRRPKICNRPCTLFAAATQGEWQRQLPVA